MVTSVTLVPLAGWLSVPVVRIMPSAEGEMHVVAAQRIEFGRVGQIATGSAPPSTVTIAVADAPFARRLAELAAEPCR